jgi:moderate conductance mechanosensitive channel
MLLNAATTTSDSSSLEPIVEETAAAVTLFTATTARIVATIVIGIVVALVLRHLLHRLTLRVMRASEPLVRFGQVAARTANVSLGAGLVERREQRAETLNSVLGSAINVIVGSIVALLVMKELGWDIGPLLTSVGVVGIALAFGAQSLVKDVLSGIFMLFEDQYGIGDLVDFGTVSGTVEAVGLRVTRVRDTGGTLWYLRNGEILRVGNQSQGWTRAVVDVRVGPEADIDATREVLLATATALAADPDYADTKTFGDPGVTFAEDFAGGATQLRVVVKTQPGEQAAVASELRRRIRLALAKAEIPLATT